MQNQILNIELLNENIRKCNEKLACVANLNKKCSIALLLSLALCLFRNSEIGNSRLKIKICDVLGNGEMNEMNAASSNQH